MQNMKRALTTIGIAVVLLALMATAMAHEGHDAGAEPDAEIYLGDLYIRPAGGEPGDPIRASVGKLNLIQVTNEGEIEHELHFGRDPNLDTRLYEENLFGHGGAHAAHGFLGVVLAPGETTLLHVWIPDDRTGEWELACFIPGHYEAGQRAPLILIQE